MNYQLNTEIDSINLILDGDKKVDIRRTIHKSKIERVIQTYGRVILVDSKTLVKKGYYIPSFCEIFPVDKIKDKFLIASFTPEYEIDEYFNKDPFGIVIGIMQYGKFKVIK